ncbi:MAG: helix-turn-helix domain-containing protein [Rhizobiaceae bacterium]
MPQSDRLTALVSRFRLVVSPSPADEANLAIVGTSQDAPDRVLFHPGKSAIGLHSASLLLTAKVEWGGTNNPLVAALPEKVEYDLADRPMMANVAALMCGEVQNRRCGLHSVISRLGEVLVVHMLRAQMEAGSTRPGLVGGLSDPRLGRAIVAIHDNPGHAWRREELAEIAGMSLSRFSELFLERVGETPSAYLRRWRLILAQQDLRDGDRVETIAHRYGYESADGFTRAFRRYYGQNPVAYRNRIAA